MKKTAYTLLFLSFIFLCLAIFSNHIEAKQGDLVYLIPISGEIDPGLVNLVNRGIKEAESLGVDLIVFKIDTYGGLVDSAIRIRDLILLSHLPTLAYIEGRAWSAGALIALAAEQVVMVPGSSIGAAETRPREEKYISAMRKEFKATAERRGKNAQLAEAMVDSDLEIPDIIEKGKLLSLTTKEAVELNIADFAVNNFSELWSRLEMKPFEIIEITPTTPERLARAVTNPTFSILLLTLGLMALVLEVLTPGFGLGGTVGLLSLGTFFTGYMINDASNWGLFVLFIIGLILIAIEIFVVPGFGVTGIGGIIAIFLSIFLLFPTPERAIIVLGLTFIFTVIGSTLLIKFFGLRFFWQRISLNKRESKEAGYVAQEAQTKFIGKRGKTVSPLRPAGILEIEGKRLDVVSEGGYIDKDQVVEVIKIAGNRIIVRKV